MYASHYTFDFAQQVTLPSSARQVGPIYFKTPRKVQLFGVCSEGIPKQVNYLLDEATTIGQDGKKSHGANTIVSLLHHFFQVHGHGEKGCQLHADNCAGQNKNKTVMAYLAWRCMVGLHEKISLSFMIAGHTRCLVDGCFGHLKRKYRCSDVFTLEQLANTVDASAACNVSQPFEDSEIIWYDWDAYLMQYFKAIPGVSKMHHFTFSAQHPGTVLVKKTVDSSEASVTITKASADVSVLKSTMPPVIPPTGLSPERQRYLYEQIREFVPPAFQDQLCPAPLVDME